MSAYISNKTNLDTREIKVGRRIVSETIFSDQSIEVRIDYILVDISYIEAIKICSVEQKQKWESRISARNNEILPLENLNA